MMPCPPATGGAEGQGGSSGTPTRAMGHAVARREVLAGLRTSDYSTLHSAQVTWHITWVILVHESAGYLLHETV